MEYTMRFMVLAAVLGGCSVHTSWGPAAGGAQGKPISDLETTAYPVPTPTQTTDPQPEIVIVATDEVPSPLPTEAQLRVLAQRDPETKPGIAE